MTVRPNEPSRAAPDVLLNTFGYVLARSARQLYDATEADLRNAGLSVGLYPILLLVSEHGPLTQTRLVALTSKDKNRIVEDVDALELLGAVRRDRHPKDRRAHAVSITVSGKRLLAKCQRAVSRCERVFLAPLDRTQQQDLRGMLRSLLVNSLGSHGR